MNQSPISQKCHKCEKITSDEIPGVKCECCKIILCSECGGLSATECQVLDLKTSGVLIFMCPECRDDLKQLPTLINLITGLKEEICSLKRDHEHRDRTRTIAELQKRKNVMLFGVPEATSANVEQRKKEDSDGVARELSAIPDCEHPVAMVHLGKQQPDHSTPRPLEHIIPDNMKTSASILQELAVKRREVVEYDLVYQGGPPHQMIFKYQCTLAGASVIATGKSKKDAKQEAARMCLEKLTSMGLYTRVPTTCSGPFSLPSPQRSAPVAADESVTTINTYVALMRELCEQFKLPAPEYELVSDTGPAHCREFEVSVKVGGHMRSAVATTKKLARQMATQQLYTYLKENLSKVITDFNEIKRPREWTASGNADNGCGDTEDSSGPDVKRQRMNDDHFYLLLMQDEALIRANQKAQDKFVEVKENEGLPWRPNLGQKLSESHLGLMNNTDPSKRLEVLKIIDNVVTGDDLVEKVDMVLKVLGLEYEWSVVPSNEKYKVLVVLSAPRADPPFALTSPPQVESIAKQNTARQTLEYIKIMFT